MDDSTVQEHRAMGPVKFVDQLQRLRTGSLLDIDTKRDRVAEKVRGRERSEQATERGGPVVGDYTDLELGLGPI